jgi:hypothetical protein
LFYWAGFYGWDKINDFFLEKIGISPFMKLFRNQSVVDACVIGQQYDMLKDMIEDTYKGINNLLPKERHYFVKYKCDDFLQMDYYWKSR